MSKVAFYSKEPQVFPQNPNKAVEYLKNNSKKVSRVNDTDKYESVILGANDLFRMNKSTFGLSSFYTMTYDPKTTAIKYSPVKKGLKVVTEQFIPLNEK